MCLLWVDVVFLGENIRFIEAFSFARVFGTSLSYYMVYGSNFID